MDRVLSGWGRYPKSPCRIVEAGAPAGLAALVAAESALIARGNGRSYGDAALNPAATLMMGRHDRFMDFDRQSGRLTCEAGTLLADIVAALAPRGWFPPVTPGTKFVTVGGMIAADVHGKNHHGAGTFGAHLDHFDLMLADGSVATCSATRNADLFEATRGGMGLTGVIVNAAFRMLPIETPWVRQETLRADNLDQVMEQFEASQDWTYTVAWIDCLARGRALGRSLLYRGEHARTGEAPACAPAVKRIRTVPVDLPGFALNRYSVAAFNHLYFRAGRPGIRMVDLDTFFYPLDALSDWNRIYGRRGFVQYQCVIPKAFSRAGIGALLNAIGDSGAGSFLAVLKLFGGQSGGLLSFPMEGYTLALDFPMTHKTLALVRRLDAIVADHGGRIYLAKDSCSDAAMVQRGYPALDRFRAVRAAHDPVGKFSSLQSQRLGL